MQERLAVAARSEAERPAVAHRQAAQLRAAVPPLVARPGAVQLQAARRVAERSMAEPTAE